MLHRLILFFLLLNFSFPVALDSLVLLLLNAHLFFESEDIILQLPLLILHQLTVGLERRTFVLNHRLSLLDLLHVILHLALEVVLQETEQILLDVNLLDLAIDSLKLAVNFRLLHLAQAAKLTSHFDYFVLLLLKFVLFTLLFDFCDDLRLDQIKL